MRPTPLPVARIDGDVRIALTGLGTVFADTGDGESGCLGHGLEIDGSCWFVKYVVGQRGRDAQGRAMDLHLAVKHPALVPLIQQIDGTHGPILVYPWIDGERLRGSRRMVQRPLSEVLAACEAIIDLHVAIDNAGFVSIDLYDGNMLHDDRIHLIDVDEYQRAPHVLDAERTLGSTRFMAPEEFRRGASLDSRTMVFQLGRMIAVLLDPPDGRSMRRAPELARLVARATAENPADRHQTVADLIADWRSLRIRNALTPA